MHCPVAHSWDEVELGPEPSRLHCSVATQESCFHMKAVVWDIQNTWLPPSWTLITAGIPGCAMEGRMPGPGFATCTLGSEVSGITCPALIQTLCFGVRARGPNMSCFHPSP